LRRFSGACSVASSTRLVNRSRASDMGASIVKRR
jgi:hypothetical protein